MVGRDVLLRVEKPTATPGEPLLEVSDLSARDDRGLPAVRDVSLRRARGRDRRHRRRRRQRPERADRGDHGAARARRRAGASVGGHDVTRRARATTLDAGVGHIAEDRHRRGLVLEFDLAENLCLREYRKPGVSRCGWLSPKKMADARAAAAEGVRRARRRRRTRSPASLSGGNQQKVVIARELSADPQRDHRRPADARAGRRRDRVRPPPAGRGARRGPRDPARLARARGDPLAARPRARDLRGRDRRRAAARRPPRRTSAWP